MNYLSVMVDGRPSFLSQEAEGGFYLTEGNKVTQIKRDIAESLIKEAAQLHVSRIKSLATQYNRGLPLVMFNIGVKDSLKQLKIASSILPEATVPVVRKAKAVVSSSHPKIEIVADYRAKSSLIKTKKSKVTA